MLILKRKRRKRTDIKNKQKHRHRNKHRDKHFFPTFPKMSAIFWQITTGQLSRI